MVISVYGKLLILENVNIHKYTLWDVKSVNKALYSEIPDELRS